MVIFVNDITKEDEGIPTMLVQTTRRIVSPIPRQHDKFKINYGRYCDFEFLTISRATLFNIPSNYVCTKHKNLL